MPTLYLVRHAQPAAAWSEALDPGLSETGRQQAAAAAQTLAELESSLPLFSSPLQRCRETAAPLAASWRTGVNIMPEVAEIPSPPLDLAARSRWLVNAMRGDWEQLQASAPAESPNYSRWRAELVSALKALRRDAIIFTHYLSINIAVGAAQNSERVVNFQPAHASITEIAIDAGVFSVRRLGHEAPLNSGILLGR